MITLILHGKLGQKFAHPETGRTWRLAAKSPAEAFYAIDKMMGGFFNYIMELESEMQGYHVQVGERNIRAEMLAFGFNDEIVTVTPILRGADNKAELEIVAGVAIIALGIATYGGAFAGIGIAGGLSLTVIETVGLGLAVTLGGISRLLANTPSQVLGTQDKTRSSYIFSGIVNTIQQGECVPICYGNPIHGSAVVAASVETFDVAT